MIAELRVRDLATIDDVTVTLGEGLNVLTGETGAGKSILVDALSLLLGGRADAALVRTGAKKAVVEGAFENLGTSQLQAAEAAGLDPDDDRLVIRREVSAEGRSRAWVNGSPTTATVLSGLAEWLVTIHGQHDTALLVRADAQREMLDGFAGADAERAAVAEAWHALRSVDAEIALLRERRDDVNRRADYLRHVVREIGEAHPVIGEDEQLAVEARRLRQADTIAEQAGALAGALDGDEASALAALGRAERALQVLERADPELASWRAPLDSAYLQLQELARDAMQLAANIDDQAGTLDEVETRRSVLGRLQQKYGGSIEAVLATERGSRAELDVLDTADVDLRALEARGVGARAALAAAADALRERRVVAAAGLSRSVTRLLPGLGLAGGKFTVGLADLETTHEHGSDRITFDVRLNAGLQPQALARVASGGELSRLMLALKSVLAGQDQVPTVVFDEIDQGIGGEVGARVGATLAQVAERHQVLVITHLPQIAARADRHLTVAKRTSAGMATTAVDVLHGEDRIIELARMLGDSDADTARRHAQTLLAGGTAARG